MSQKSIFTVPNKKIVRAHHPFDRQLDMASRRSAAFADTTPVELSPSQVRIIDPVLSEIALGYRNQDLIGENLFPRVPVGVRGGNVIQFGKEDFKKYNLRRAPGASTQEVTFGYLGVSFALVQDALKIKVPREYQEDAEAVPGIDLGTRAVQKGMKIALTSLEYDHATLATTAGNYADGMTETLSGTSQWDDPGNQTTDIVEQWLDYQETIRAKCGTYANVAWFGPMPWKAFRRHTVVKSQFQYTTPAMVDEERAAQLLRVKKVVVGAAVTADDSGDMSDIWGNYAGLAYVPQELTAMEEPSFGYTYVYRGMPLADRPYWDDDKKSWMYPVTFDRLAQLTGIEAGFLIESPSNSSD